MRKEILIYQIIAAIILFIILYRIVKINKTIKYNDRLSKFTVKTNEPETKSLADNIVDSYCSFRLKLAKSLSKRSAYKKLAKKYERYVHKPTVSYLDAMIIISNKFCISIICGLSYFIINFIRGTFNPFLMLLSFILGFFVYNIYLSVAEAKRNKEIEDDLLKAIVIMNNAFKSGYNITQAIDLVTQDLTGPISEEFERIGNDLKYGLEVKDVFDRFYDRVQIEDAKYITSSLNLLNLTGGNLVGIFTNIEKSFTNNKRLRDELNAMTSSSKFVYYILLIMPIVLITTLNTLNPTYFKPLLSHPIGYLIIILAITLYISYIIIIKKILRVD